MVEQRPPVKYWPTPQAYDLPGGEQPTPSDGGTPVRLTIELMSGSSTSWAVPEDIAERLIDGSASPHGGDGAGPIRADHGSIVTIAIASIDQATIG